MKLQVATVAHLTCEMCLFLPFLFHRCSWSCHCDWLIPFFVQQLWSHVCAVFSVNYCFNLNLLCPFRIHLNPNTDGHWGHPLSKERNTRNPNTIKRTTSMFGPSSCLCGQFAHLWLLCNQISYPMSKLESVRK